MRTECCDVEIADDWRFCPRCGWEARVVAGAAPAHPDFWRCLTCGCLWRDNHDDTVSLASAKQTSCAECEMKGTPTTCEPLYRGAAPAQDPDLDLKWKAASKFIRDVLFALGKPEPAAEAVVDLPAIALEVLGQIEELKLATTSAGAAPACLGSESCQVCEKFECAKCHRLVPACCGADDNEPESCDTCWLAAHGAGRPQEP